MRLFVIVTTINSNANQLQLTCSECHEFLTQLAKVQLYERNTFIILLHFLINYSCLSACNVALKSYHGFLTGSSSDGRSVYLCCISNDKTSVQSSENFKNKAQTILSFSSEQKTQRGSCLIFLQYNNFLVREIYFYTLFPPK